MVDGSQDIDFILDKFVKFRNAFELLEVHLFYGEVLLGDDVLTQVDLAELTVPDHTV